MTRKILLLVLIAAFSSPLWAQKVDSIYFHLYTDSLKKGQHNYINVDGKLSTGKWVPMTAKDVIFSCNEAAFKGNELIIPEDFTLEKVTVRASLRLNPFMVIEKTIWIKKKPDPALPAMPNKVKNKN